MPRIANGVSKSDLGGPWRTTDALWTARFRLGLPYSRPGAWYLFDEAVSAAIDGDREVLMDVLAALEGRTTAGADAGVAWTRATDSSAASLSRRDTLAP
jgi:hypothetical protein